MLLWSNWELVVSDTYDTTTTTTTLTDDVKCNNFGWRENLLCFLLYSGPLTPSQHAFSLNFSGLPGFSRELTYCYLPTTYIPVQTPFRTNSSLWTCIISWQFHLKWVTLWPTFSIIYSHWRYIQKIVLQISNVYVCTMASEKFWFKNKQKVKENDESWKLTFLK